MATLDHEVPPPAAGVQDNSLDAERVSDSMMSDKDRERVREHARQQINALRGLGTDADLQTAKPLVIQLCDQHDYALMGELCELISRRVPDDMTNRRRYGQYLIDSGYATVAIDVLEALLAQLPNQHAETSETIGLLGRAHKQIFCDAGDKGSQPSRDALRNAIAWYRKPWEANRDNVWHGVNLVALLARARVLDLPVAKTLDSRVIARQVIERLEQYAESDRDAWYHAMLAEASLALGNWDVVETHVNAYAATTAVQEFHIASTLRQLTEVWDIERTDPRGRSLVDILRARLLQLKGGSLVLKPDQVQELQQALPPRNAQLEAVLGRDGPQTYAWWKTGLTRALSVAAIRQALGGRIGTGFLVRAGDVGSVPADELLVLTNFHVVNEQGTYDGVRPEDAEVVFEAVDPGRVYTVAQIVWSSPPGIHDASLLRLSEPVVGISPLPLAAALPVLEDAPRVYVIGYPGGRDLAFSFQDNELLDHEGAPLGKPQIEGAIRVHYRTPTEGGSSGSPVFNSRLWQVVALHHKGGKTGMPRLNGAAGTYSANEGIAIQSIVAALKARALGGASPPA